MQDSLTWFDVIGFFTIIMLLMLLAKRDRTRIVLLITCSILICASGLRHGYIDTRAYRYMFDSTEPQNVLNWSYIADSSDRYKGFSFIIGLIKTISNDSQVFIFIMALVTVGCFFIRICKDSHDPSYGIFLFLTTGLYLDSMNGIRQALVSAVLFLTLPHFLKKRKCIIYFVTVLLASLVHNTALLFIPMYFFVDSKPWSNKTIFLLASCIILFLFYDFGIGRILFLILDGTSYGASYGIDVLSGNTSVNIVRVLISAVPIVLSYVIKKQGLEEESFTYNLCFNMSIVNFCIWIFSMRVMYFYRLTIYFVPYSILLLCQEMKMFKKTKNGSIIKGSSVLLYIIYYVIQLYISGASFFVGYLKY